MTHWSNSLDQLSACSEAVEWCHDYDSLESAWAACERGDWMLWLAGRVSGDPGSDARQTLSLAVCECARLAWQQMGVPGRAAIETAERWARGEGATLDDVRSAYAAAASSCAASYAAASSYAADAADAASSSSYAAAASYTADAKQTGLRECADIVRRHYPIPPKLEVTT